MAEPAKDTDQSMEDILQSIKRIIADEGEAAPAPPPGSDVLELTELLAEDAAPPAPAAEPSPPAAPPAEMSIDDIMAAPAEAFTAPAPVVEAPPPPPPSPVVESAPAPVAGDKLISDATLAASAAALSTLAQRPAPPPVTHNSPVLRSGTTVEDLVIEAIKPMLKEWLDGNLPALVRSLVEREIRRISGS